MTGMTNVTKLASEPSGQEFLVFTLGDEEYGIDIPVSYTHLTLPTN